MTAILDIEVPVLTLANLTAHSTVSSRGDNHAWRAAIEKEACCFFCILAVQKKTAPKTYMLPCVLLADTYVLLYVCLSTRQTPYLSIYLSIYRSTYLPNLSIYLL